MKKSSVLRKLQKTAAKVLKNKKLIFKLIMLVMMQVSRQFLLTVLYLCIKCLMEMYYNLCKNGFFDETQENFSIYIFNDKCYASRTG
jgi:hypothetical protein